MRRISYVWRLRSSVAQWQSIRLLTEGLLVRVQPGEPFLDTKVVSFFSIFLGLDKDPLVRPFVCLRDLQKAILHIDRILYNLVR